MFSDWKSVGYKSCRMIRRPRVKYCAREHQFGNTSFGRLRQFMRLAVYWLLRHRECTALSYAKIKILLLVKIKKSNYCLK